jgi:fatty acid desaturase
MGNDGTGCGAEDIRRRIRAALPPEAFAPRPQRALWFLPLVATTLGGITVLVTTSLPWPLALLIGLVVGQSLAATGFLAHEVLHGSVVRTRWLQTLLGGAGFWPMLISPTLWRTWHNHLHHGHTNRSADPDAFGTVRRYRRARSTRVVIRLAPGSGNPISALFLGYWFVFHGQVVLWLQSTRLRGFSRMNRPRAIAESLAALAAWVAVAVAAGPVGAVFAVLVPVVVANAVTMSYIATNHFMRPMGTSNNPLDSSMSVRTSAFLDRLHFHFSHHVEHHLFPTMSGRHTPLVRAWLRRHEPDRYVCPSHARALLFLYRTPRVYLDATTLVDPTRLPFGPRVDTRDLALALRDRRDAVGAGRG